jgi:hypothetical protein
MSIYDGIKRIQDILTLSLNASLRWINHAYTGTVLTVRRDFDDATETVFMNYTVGFIDDDAKISDGTTSLSTWKDAAGASDLFIVKEWDTSGKSNHVSQSTTSLQPKLVLNGSGNRATAVFGGSTDRTRLASAALTYSGQSTVFAVYKSTVRQGLNNGVFSSGLAANNNTFQLSYRGVPDYNLVCQAWDSLGGSTITARVAIESSENINSISLASVVLDGSSDNIKTYFNGVFSEEKTIADGFTGLYENYKIGIASNDTQFFNGEIYEVLVFREIFSSTQRASIENDIKQAYGIS